MRRIDAAFAAREAHICGEPAVEVTADDAPDALTAALLRVAKDMHEEKYGRLQPDPQVAGETYVELNRGLQMGFKYGKDAGSDPAVLHMQRNLFRFSQAKSLAQAVELNSALYEGGQVRSWDEFRKAVLSVNDKYNLNYLQAEYQTARSAGQHARNWQKYESQSNIFPNLKYRTAGDRRVRPEHEVLDGKVAPINSAFWDKYYPPNGWRCRCYVVQTAEAISGDLPEEVPEVAPQFRSNVGKRWAIFPEPKRLGEAKTQLTFFDQPQLKNATVLREMELQKLDVPGTLAHTAANGATVTVSPFADMQDLQANLETGKVIADRLGKDVKIRAHLDRTIAKGKNPEYEIDGHLADRKGVKSVKGIADAIDSAKKQMLDKDTNPDQKAYSIVVDLSEVAEVDLTQLRTALSRKIGPQRGRNIHSVMVVRGKKAVELTRDEIVRRDYGKLQKIQ